MATPLDGQWLTLDIERGIHVQIFLVTSTNTVANTSGYMPQIVIGQPPLENPSIQSVIAARQPVFTGAVAALAGNTISQVTTASNKQNGTLWRAWSDANHKPSSGGQDDLTLIGWK